MVYIDKNREIKNDTIRIFIPVQTQKDANQVRLLPKL